MSALFVLRKFLFNRKRYHLDDQINHSENLEKFVLELKTAVRLFEWVGVNNEKEQSELEQYLLKIQIHELLYKIHHTILSLMPFEIENHIEELDDLLKSFNPELLMDYEPIRIKMNRFILWLEQILKEQK
jgi:hypothetical protein